MSDAPHSLLPADVHEPYIGLKPYTEAERDRFFGRERDAQLLINKLFSHPLTLLYAPSGVGKTSLLRALVIPELRAEEAQVVYFDKWNTPDPCDAVAQAIAGSPQAPGSGQLVDAARIALSRDDSTLVLVLDQFEEYLQRYAGDLGHLPAALGALLRTPLDLRVVLSFREEFLASVDACLRGHVLSLFASTYHLEHLDRDRAREAIAAPARRFGGVCDKELVDRLLDDLAPGDPEKSAGRLFRGGIELPFLQLICRCLWDKALTEGAPGLRKADYLALGGRRGIIAAYLHDVTRHFSRYQSFDAAQVLKALAPRSGVKIAYPLDALAAQAGTSDKRTERVLDVLREHRIVRTREAAGGVSYELQHDAFIEIVRPWAERCLRLRNWFVRWLTAVITLTIGLNVYSYVLELRDGRTRQLAAEVADRIEFDTRDALKEALNLATRSSSPNASNTLRLAISAFLQDSTLAPHNGAANSVAFSRDGAWLVTAGYDGEVRLFDSRNLAMLSRYRHAGPVVAVSLSEDGSRVVSAGLDGVLRVSDRSGKVVTECGHVGGPPWLDVDISRDGKRVVAIRGSEDGTTPDLLLTGTGGACALARLSGHFGNVVSASFDDSGKWVLSYGNDDNTARIWDTADGRLSATLTHPDEVYGASFSPDGTEVAVAVADGTIYRWTARGRLIGRPLELPVQSGKPPVSARSVRYAPDGRRLVVASSDGSVYVWDVSSNVQPAGLAPYALPGGHIGGALAAYFSPDGRRILSYGWDDTVRVWDEPFTFRAREFRGHAQEVRAALFAPDSSRVVSAGADGTVRLWSLQPVDLLPVIGTGLILSADGKYSFRIATGELFETGGNVTGRVLINNGEVVRSAAFSSDARLIAVGLTSGRLRVQPVNGEANAFEANDLDGPICALAFDGRGRRLVSGGADGRLRLYDLDTPRQDKNGIAAHAGPVNSVDIHPDGERIVSTGADGSARVWSWDRQALSTLEGEADRVRDARFSADGKRILRRNGDRITTFDGEAWARADDELTDFARSLLDTRRP